MKLLNYAAMALTMGLFVLAAQPVAAFETRPQTAGARTAQKPVVKVRAQKPWQMPPLILVKKPLVYYNAGFFSGDMTGWTPITNGASKGGASMIQTANGSYIITRGGDNGIYIAPFDPGQPAVIDSSAWTLLNEGATSEPSCVYVPTKDYEKSGYLMSGISRCGFLGATGNALVSETYWNIDGMENGFWDELYGENGGAAPTIISGPVEAYVGPGAFLTQYGVVVWDGATGLFQESVAYQSKGFGGNRTKDWVDWTKKPDAITSPPGCVIVGPAYSVCAVATDDNRVHIIEFGAPGEPITWLSAVSDVMPDGLSGKPALVRLKSGRVAIVMRTKKGTLAQALYDYSDGFTGGWKNEGGFVIAGSTPTCLARNEQPVCVIQGNGGKLYAKALAAPSGL